MLRQLLIKSTNSEINRTMKNYRINKNTWHNPNDNHEVHNETCSKYNKIELFEKHFSKDEKAYFIDEGGAGPFGAKGCEEIVTELTETYDKIFCAVGTATTLHGIAQAIKNNGLPTKAEGICVLKGADEIDTHLKGNGLENYYKTHHQFHEGGYAKTNPEQFDFIKLFASRSVRRKK